MPSAPTLPLTPERMHSALYCCAPVGWSSLAAHLYAFGIDNSQNAMDEAVGKLVGRGVRIAAVDSAIGGRVVKLITLPGQERVA